MDAGALVALERNDRPMWRRWKAALIARDIPITHGGVVGQVWRARGPRQALLAKVLAGIDVRGLDDALGHAAGELLGHAHRGDVIDAALVSLAGNGDHILSSDPDDLATLARASGLQVEIIRA